MKYILYYSFFLYSLFRFYNNKTKQNAEYITKNAIRCGPIGLKLLQFLFMSPLNMVKSDTFEFTLENCTTHSIEETEEMYKNVFNKHISEDYILHEIVGSGSIGQVYRAYNLKTRQFVALKIKHPGIDITLKETISALRFICFFIKWINVYNSYDIIMSFIDNIQLQTDYIQEAKNTIKLKNLFCNEKCILIPEIYTFNNTFIEMSYHSGESYKNVSEKTKIISSFLLNMFYISSITIYDFLHSDLHYGNWKVIEENNEVKILIYDCGIMCRTHNLEFNKQLMISCVNRRTFLDILDLIKNDENELLIIKHKSEFEKLIDFKVSASQAFTNFTKKLLHLKIVKDQNFINLLYTIIMCNNASSKSTNKIAKYLFSESKSSVILFELYVYILNKLDQFHDLKLWFREYIENDPKNKIIYDDWLFENFGHRNANIFNDIIYSIIFNKER